MAVCLSYRDVYGPVTTNTPDWNGGARSAIAFAANCFYGFEVPRASVGVVVGLNSPDEGQHYLEIDHGFHFTRGTVSVMEGGARVGVGPLFYTEGTRYYVVRQGTTVIYCQRPSTAPETAFFVDPRFPTLLLPGVVLHVSTRASYGEVFLDASMFAVGDSILNESAGEIWFVGAEDEDLASSLAGSGSLTGELPFSAVAAGGGIESFAVVSLPFEVYGESRAAVSLNVQMPFSVLGSDIELNTIMVGALPFTAFGDGSGAGVYTQLAGVSGLLPFSVDAVGYENGAGADVDLGFVAFGTGTDSVGAGAVPSGAYGEMPFEASGTTSAQLDNTFSIFLRLVGAPAAGRLPQESIVSELVRVIAAPPKASYANRLRENLRIASTPRTSITYEATLAEDVAVAALSRGDFRVDVVEALEALESVTFTQIALVADALLATGSTATFYTAIVEVLAALTVRDDRLNNGAGSSGGATGGGAVTDPDGSDTDPATITLTGYFYAGTSIKVTFETTDGGVDTVYYVVPENTDAAGAAAGLAALLDDHPSLIATSTDGVITLLAQESGNTLTILGIEIIPAAGTGTGVGGTTGAAYSASAVSELTAGGTIALALQRIATFLDAVTVADTLTNRLTIIVEETAEFEASDSFELTSTLLANLLDTVDVYTMFRVSDDVAQGWVMNTEGAQPISEYSNFTFNSMTFYRDQMFMAGDAGIYTHAAEDDAGADITAQISSMLLDFGTSRMKRIRSAYLGYTATNELVMKVRSVSQGQLSEYWYKATQTKTPGAPDGGYMPVGQGLKSRYWQFELTNIDGGDFEIDQVELHPLVLNRRV